MASNEKINEKLQDINKGLRKTSTISSTVSSSVINYSNINDIVSTEVGVKLNEADTKIEDISLEGVGALGEFIQTGSIGEDPMEQSGLDTDTENLSEILDNTQSIINSTQGIENQILKLQDAALVGASNITDTIQSINKGVEYAQHIARRGFFDLEERFRSSAEAYLKKKLIGAAEEEFREQIELYYQLKDIVDNVTRSKQLALSVWAKTKNNYTTAVDSYATLKESISLLYNNLVLLIRLIK